MLRSTVAALLAARALAQTAGITITASHGGAGNGLTNTTISVPIGQIYTNPSVLDTVSYLYLVSSNGVDVNSITCQAYMDQAATRPGGQPFSFGKPSFLDLNTVQVGSLVCNSTNAAAGNLSTSALPYQLTTSTDYHQSSTYVFTVSPISTISPPPGTQTSVGSLAQAPSQYTFSTGSVSGSVTYTGPGLPTYGTSNRVTPVGGPHTATPSSSETVETGYTVVSSATGAGGQSTVQSTMLVTTTLGGAAGGSTAAAQTTTVIAGGESTNPPAATTSAGNTAEAATATTSEPPSVAMQSGNSAVGLSSQGGLDKLILGVLSLLFLL